MIVQPHSESTALRPGLNRSASLCRNLNHDCSFYLNSQGVCQYCWLDTSGYDSLRVKADQDLGPGCNECPLEAFERMVAKVTAYNQSTQKEN